MNPGAATNNVRHALCVKLLSADLSDVGLDGETLRLVEALRVAIARERIAARRPAGFCLPYLWWRRPVFTLRAWLAWLGVQVELRRLRREKPMLFAPPGGWPPNRGGVYPSRAAREISEQWSAYATIHGRGPV